MIKTKFIALLSVGILAAMAAPAFAHHSGAMFESEKTITLDGVVCSGDLSLRRWFCSRAIYPYWRECWLERAQRPDQSPAAAESKA